jgi:PAS domain S-box-containing protein
MNETRTHSNLRRLFSSNLLGMNIADLDGRIHSANDCFLEIVGYSRDELPLSWVELTPPEWHTVDQVKTEEVRATGKGLFWEKEFLRKDGSRVPVQIAVTLLEESRDECVALVLDLTETKRAEAALRESERRYRSLYDNIPLMYFTLAYDGVIRSVNTHGAQELGYRPEELVGQPILRVFHPEDRTAVERRMKDFAQRPEGVAKWEFRKVRKNGSVLWVRETVTAIREPDGTESLMVVCEDVTDRKESEQRLVEYQSQLQTLTSALAAAEERERRRIASGLHDEIGQVLAMTRLKMDELDRSAVAGEGRERINEICRLLDRCIASTRSLTFELASPALYELGLDAALEDLGERMEQHEGIRFRFAGDGSCKGFKGDHAIVLFRIARELVQNVVKHSRGTTLGIEIATIGDELRISVEDDGVGFDSTAADKALGSADGFGLFSIREQLDRLGGRLDIRSSPGEGTKVEVVVPAKPREK